MVSLQDFGSVGFQHCIKNGETQGFHKKREISLKNAYDMGVNEKWSNMETDQTIFSKRPSGVGYPQSNMALENTLFTIYLRFTGDVP